MDASSTTIAVPARFVVAFRAQDHRLRDGANLLLSAFTFAPGSLAYGAETADGVGQRSRACGAQILRPTGASRPAIDAAGLRQIQHDGTGKLQEGPVQVLRGHLGIDLAQHRNAALDDVIAE